MQEVAVFGIPSEEWGETVHAVVVARPGDRRLTPEVLMAFAREHLAGYKVPRSIAFADELPNDRVGQVHEARAARAVLARPHEEGGLARGYAGRAGQVSCRRAPR